MINDDVQKQIAGDGSILLQAGGGIVLSSGISYADARQIALDVYEANIQRFTREAVELARERVERITDDFLGILRQEHESVLTSLRDPGMQMALYAAQRQYAKTGDPDLEQLLVNMLRDRALTPERNIQQIVLDEAIESAALLTAEHVSALTLAFTAGGVKFQTATTIDAIASALKSRVLPFTEYDPRGTSCFRHLDYAGCGSVTELDQRWEAFMQRNYRTFFVTENEIREVLLARYPMLKTIADIWNGCELNSFRISPVGIAIAQANLRAKLGICYNLSDFVK